MLSVVEYKKNKNLPKKLKSTIRKNIQHTYRVLFFCAQRQMYKLNLNTAGGYTRKLHTRYLRGQAAPVQPEGRAGVSCGGEMLPYNLAIPGLESGTIRTNLIVYINKTYINFI